MEAIECIKTRRSVRRYTEEQIPKETLMEIVSAAAMSPSWKNSQTVRWNIVTDRGLLDKIAEEAVMDFDKNTSTIKSCTCLAVQSVVTGIAGYEPDGSFTTDKGDSWEMYDSGIAAQSFCLAAHAYGVGSVILGIIDGSRLAEMLNIPENERITGAIAMGYPKHESKMPPKLTAEEIVRFAGNK